MPFIKVCAPDRKVNHKKGGHGLGKFEKIKRRKGAQEEPEWAVQASESGLPQWLREMANRGVVE